jgi:subtilisin family serine protease
MSSIAALTAPIAEKTVFSLSVLKKADFSNYGSFTTIYAPGTHILGAKPNNQYEYLDGTSMASPIVSGFIALLKSQHKNADFSQIFALLNKNTTQINNLNILKYNNLN